MRKYGAQNEHQGLTQHGQCIRGEAKVVEGGRALADALLHNLGDGPEHENVVCLRWY